MKLRIRGNSLRLRLLQTEVATLAETGTVSEKISFGAGADLIYTVSTSAQESEVSARFAGNEIVIFIPESVVKNWAESAQASIEKDQGLDRDSNTLKILIEKDFVCLERTDDPDNKDAFPHPKANC
jgi:hypothetical protein